GWNFPKDTRNALVLYAILLLLFINVQAMLDPRDLLLYVTLECGSTLSIGIVKVHGAQIISCHPALRDQVDLASLEN
ncbi:hypothetical protein M8C21_021789, partial [Ambrosia artemisiifolia]